MLGNAKTLRAKFAFWGDFDWEWEHVDLGYQGAVMKQRLQKKTNPKPTDLNFPVQFSLSSFQF